MPLALPRNKTDLLGTVASPATVAAATPVSSTVFDLTDTTNGQIDDVILTTTLIAGSPAPTTPPTVGYYISSDGTKFYLDGGTISVPMTAGQTVDVNPYRVPRAARKAMVTITGGGTNGITAFVQAAAVAVLVS